MIPRTLTHLRNLAVSVLAWPAVWVGRWLERGER